jgi:beta-xylosidase
MSAPAPIALDDVAVVLEQMTLDEKLAQLVGLWPDVTDGPAGPGVAPMQHEMLAKVREGDFDLEHGLGQLTRPLGSRVVPAAEMASTLRDLQDRIIAGNRFGLPALVHEECLTGLQLYGATTYPAPLAWGAAWNPGLVEAMGRCIGASMRALGIHLGLAPVLDLVRDPRWGRVEECIAEDPYLVGTIGVSYVRGIQAEGPGATLKHFLGYSGSEAGRNLAPVHAGGREILERFSVPFEMAVRLARPAAVMHSYAEIDGVPVAGDPTLLTGLLRDRWGFDGTVVADYFGVAFLHTLHDVAVDLEAAATMALTAGIDVELPTGNAYLDPLRKAIDRGTVDIALVDRAVERVLRQKVALGVTRLPTDATAAVELDPAASRTVAREIAEQSIILLANTGVLPLGGVGTIAVVGPNADSAEALMGNYSFTNHVEVPAGTPLGIDVPTVLQQLQSEFPGVPVVHEPGCAVRADGESADDAARGIAAAVRAAVSADVAVVVVGDRAGLFGRGTVGEGSDTDDLRLPGRQSDLIDAVVETGTPTVLVLVTGRPYPLERWATRAAAVVQSFFPGEDGASAIAGVLSGRVNPSGRLPVSMPGRAGGLPYSYLHPRLGAANAISSIDPAPLYPFGHGLSYTRFEHSELTVAATAWDTRATLTVECLVRNTGDRAGADVVQLYVRDLFGSVTRPMRQLLGFARVALAPGAAARVTFEVSAERLALVSRDLHWQVEPGEFDLTVARSAADPGLTRRIELAGDVVELGPDRVLVTGVDIRPMTA